MQFKLLALATLFATAFAAIPGKTPQTTNWAIEDFKRGQYAPETLTEN